MRKRYILPAVTTTWQDTSVKVLIDDDTEFREWLSCVKRRESVDLFGFHWAEHPGSLSCGLFGDFCAEYTQNDIYVHVDLCLGDYYIISRYSLDEFVSMFKCKRPSTLGMCVTVKV